jgi:hypothetical protein
MQKGSSVLAFRPVLARVAAALFLSSSIGWAGPGVALADLDEIVAGEVCGTDVVFLGARGSGQPYNPAAASDYGMGPQVGAVYDGMAATQPVGRTLVAVAADDDYPAVDVGLGIVAGDYEGSVAQGADEIVSSLRQLEECESAVGGYVLAGYSQGADVMRRAIQRLDPAELDRVHAVVLLADPWFHPYLDPGVRLLGDSHQSGCVSEDACSQYGILNRFSNDRPALPAPVQLRTMSLCIEEDIVCDYPQDSLDPDVHVNGYQPVAGDIGPLVWDVIVTRGGGRFVDVGGSVFVGDIEKVAAAGVTKGCNPPVNDRYCPDDYVTRGQMAAFLSRALEL